MEGWDENENEIVTLTYYFDSINNIVIKDLIHNKAIFDLKSKNFQEELNTQQFSIGNME